MKKITGSVLVCTGAGVFAAVALLANPYASSNASPTRAAVPAASAVVAPPATAADGGPADPVDPTGHGGHAAASAPTSASAPATATLRITNFAFEAPTVAPGATVTVTNGDRAPHTVTADDGSFAVSVAAGGTATFTAPRSPGSFTFLCEIHPQMSGTLVVR